jgi:hypothetical protein
MSIPVARLVLVAVTATLAATRAEAGICISVALQFASPAPSRTVIAALELFEEQLELDLVFNRTSADAEIRNLRLEPA